MSYCVKCEKSYEENLEICPKCGAVLEQDEECSGDCSACGSACGEEHGECGGSCDTGLWPTDDNGEPVKPALLMTVVGNQVDYEMTVSLLQSFAVPTIRDYPNDINNAKILLGYSGAGMNIYVPENMLELARELLNAEPEPLEE